MDLRVSLSRYSNRISQDGNAEPVSDVGRRLFHVEFHFSMMFLHGPPPFFLVVLQEIERWNIEMWILGFDSVNEKRFVDRDFYRSWFLKNVYSTLPCGILVFDNFYRVASHSMVIFLRKDRPKY